MQLLHQLSRAILIATTTAAISASQPPPPNRCHSRGKLRLACLISKSHTDKTCTQSETLAISAVASAGKAAVLHSNVGKLPLEARNFTAECLGGLLFVLLKMVEMVMRTKRRKAMTAERINVEMWD